jgi:hypothetical protein
MFQQISDFFKNGMTNAHWVAVVLLAALVATAAYCYRKQKRVSFAPVPVSAEYDGSEGYYGGYDAAEEYGEEDYEEEEEDYEEEDEEYGDEGEEYGEEDEEHGDGEEDEEYGDDEEDYEEE